MSFTKENFSPTSSQATTSPKIWSYLSPESLISTVTASGYFNSKKRAFRTGDEILVRQGDTHFRLYVTVSGNTVTTKIIDNASVNVVNFGATGAASQDATPYIQAAIDYVESLSVPAQPVSRPVIFFPAGIYKLTSGLVVSENGIHLKGEGRLNTWIRRDPSFTTGNTITFDSGSSKQINSCGIENIHMYTSSKNTSGSHIKVVNGSYFWMRDVTLYGGYINIDFESTRFYLDRVVCTVGKYTDSNLTGTHTSGSSPIIMTDSGASFTVDALIGQKIYNTTDGSYGIVTDNDATTVTVASLNGGSNNTWETNDTYEITQILIGSSYIKLGNHSGSANLNIGWISNCNFRSANQLSGGLLDATVEHGIYIDNVDGLWISDTHFGNGLRANFYVNPTASGKQLDGIQMVNSWLDKCAGWGILFEGTPAGMYRSHLFDNLIITGADVGEGGVKIDLTSGTLTNVQFMNIDLKQFCENGFYIDNATDIRISNCAVRRAGLDTVSSAVVLGSTTTNINISNNSFGYQTNGTSTATSPYGIEINGTGHTISNNDLRGNATGGLLDSGATDTVIRDNRGYVTENSGTGSITSGSTSDVITHGLDVTPTAADIRVTLTENPTNTPGAIWVDTIGATEFTVNCENDPGVSNLDFAWQAIVL